MAGLLIAASTFGASALSIVDGNFKDAALEKKLLPNQGQIASAISSQPGQKTLVKNDEYGTTVHLFNKDQYQGSYLQTGGKVYSFSIPALKLEPLVYKNEGFSAMPDKHISNVKNYDWYIDQKNTGAFSADNCGPAALQMVLGWNDKDNRTTAQDLRAKTKPSGGWWYLADIDKALSDYQVDYAIKKIDRAENLKAIIDKGNIALVCLDSKKFKYNANPKSRLESSYQGIGGHFVLLTGYAELGAETYFEIYDPNSWGQYYKPGDLSEILFKTLEQEPAGAESIYKQADILAGKGRYFKSSSLLGAMDGWWDCVFEIYNSQSP